MNTHYINQLNNKIQILNSGPNKQIILSKQEAQGLHNEVYRLLSRIAELEGIQEQQPTEEVIRANVDGGSW